MKKAATGMVVVGLLAVGGPALAHGPSGSYEGTRDHGTFNNNVTCGRGTRASNFVVYAARSGAETCTQRGALQGRVMVVNKGTNSYVAADGDRNNRAQARGWLRVDRSGVRCGDAGGRLDSTHPTSRDTRADCG